MTDEKETRINVRVKGVMSDYVQEQIGEKGLYESQSEYIRALIRKDMEKNESADLSASIGRGLDDIKNGRISKWDVEEIRAEAKAELAQEGN